MSGEKRGLTYGDAGVDIDAGNRMVDLIKPLVRATARPGADAEIGGFGGLFDLARAGFKDPVLIGIASSGIHSNGFSLVRKIVERSGLGFDAPAPFEPGKSLGEALLVPTRLYVKSCLAAIRQTGAVKALAHITGGGFTDNIPRALPKSLGVTVDLPAVDVLPVFRWLATTGGVAVPEMLRTFNCGIGMIAIVTAEKADAVLAVLREQGERAMRIGDVVPADGGERVSYRGTLDLSL